MISMACAAVRQAVRQSRDACDAPRRGATARRAATGRASVDRLRRDARQPTDSLAVEAPREEARRARRQRRGASVEGREEARTAPASRRQRRGATQGDAGAIASRRQPCHVEAPASRRDARQPCASGRKGEAPDPAAARPGDPRPSPGNAIARHSAIASRPSSPKVAPQSLAMPDSWDSRFPYASL